MPIKLGFLINAAVAFAALAALASSASAFTLTTSPGGPIEASSNGRLTWGNSPAIECNFTFNGLLSTGPITVAAGSQLGAITEVRTANCSGGALGGLLNLPWPITITEILGELPNDAASLLYSIDNFAMNLSTFFEIVDCLWEGTFGNSVTLLPSRTPGLYTTEENVAVIPIEMPFIRGSSLCPSSIAFRGSFRLTPTNTIAVR